jgi:hypothetical protein
MPKFLQARDIDLFKSFARELVDDVIQNTIVLYKINMNETKINIYGESLNKTWNPGVQLYALYSKSPEDVVYEGFGPEMQQNITFKFDRLLCEERNIYPEIGDVIYFDTSYYEIDNTNEIQFVGGLPGQNSDRNWSIVCSTFMVSKSNLNIEERIK